MGRASWRIEHAVLPERPVRPDFSAAPALNVQPTLSQMILLARLVHFSRAQQKNCTRRTSFISSNRARGIKRCSADCGALYQVSVIADDLGDGQHRHRENRAGTGRDTEVAISMLRAFEASLQAFEKHRQLVRALQRRAASARGLPAPLAPI
jgi:hypothetical protein